MASERDVEHPGLARIGPSRSSAYTLGVINGALVIAAASLVRPDLVLSAYVLRLSGSTFMAALPAALVHLGILWPQLFVAHLAEGMPRKKPIYVVANSTRILMLGAMGLIAFALREQASMTLAALTLLCYLACASAMGACGIAFMDIVARTIPATRRGSFMGMRGVYGGVLALGGGFAVRFMLGAGGPPFPLNYAALFVAAALLLAVATVLFTMVHEPPPRHPPRSSSFADHLRRGGEILRTDANYRQLVTVRALMGTVAVGQVVLIPFAIKGLGLPESIVGVLIIMAALVALPANLVWSHIGDKRGNRLLIRMSTCAYVAAPALALLAAYLPPWQVSGWLPAACDWRVAAFILAFLVGGAGVRGCMMGSTNYLLEVAPDERRPSYLAFMRVLQAPTALLAPVIGGTLAQWVSFQAAFALACLAGLLTWWLAGRLIEPRDSATG